MKKKITCVAIMITIVMVAMSALCGCGGSDPDPKKKYVVFENIYGDEEYTVWYPNSTYKVECEYDEHKEYYFYYRAYYRDNDVPTGETGYVPVTIKGNEPGTYTVSAHINIGGSGNNGHFILDLTIKEKPDLRVMPEVRFDPNGATLEERDGETVYVYKCNYWNKYYNKYQYVSTQFPILELYYDGVKIEIPMSLDGHLWSSTKLDNGEYYSYPKDIGLYRVSYQFSDYSDVDKERFYGVTVYILVEIQE